jgi:hypothetical protein
MSEEKNADKPGYQEIMSWLLLQSKEVQRNAQVEHSSQAGPQIRLDITTPAKFIPRMPASAFDGENSSCPRICTAPSLLGCMIGIGVGYVAYNFVHGGDIRDKTDPYKGGYVISTFDYEWAVRPNKRLLEVGPKIDEYWLVGYAPEYAEYKPKKIGKVFCVGLNYGPPDAGSVNTAAVETLILHLEHKDPRGLLIHPGKRIPPGTYEIKMRMKNQKNVTVGNVYSIHEDNHIEIRPISKPEFAISKQQSAALLSHDSPILRW